MEFTLSSPDGEPVPQFNSGDISGLRCSKCRCSAHKVLPCLHAFCQACLQESLRSQTDKESKDSKIFSCPKCHYKVQILHDISELKSVSKCYKSKKFCVGDNSKRCCDNPKNCLEIGAGDSKDSSSDSIEEGVFHRRKCCNGSMNVMPGLETNSNSCNVYDDYFCSSCDVVVCSECLDIHASHVYDKLAIVLNAKHNYIENLVEQAKVKQTRHENTAAQIECIEHCLESNRNEIKKSIDRRADRLVQMIMRRRDDMIKELEKEFSVASVYYESLKSRLNDEIDSFKNTIAFADAVLSDDRSNNLLNFHNDIITQLNRLVNHLDEAMLEVHSLQFEIPDAGKEESHLEKLFGSLSSGNIKCGDADLLASFQVDLTWPTCFTATVSKDFVVAGKAGAFESEGKVLFFDRHSKLVSSYVLEKNHLPVDMLNLMDRHILLSNNKGSILLFLPDGKLLNIWEDKFQGNSGYMALSGNKTVLVTSAQEKCIHMLSCSDGKLLKTINLYSDSSQNLLDVHAISVDIDERIIVSSLEDKCIHVYSQSNSLLFSCPDYTKRSNFEIKCPSAVCCDSFGNILVADFTSDSVWLISRNGQLLGHLLTKKNGISCPNFITLDHNGQLYVGQYGGEICVFRYLSCMKNI